MSARRSLTEKPPPAPEVLRLVRYCHPAKILRATRLPGALDEPALAGLYGVAVEEYRRALAAIRREAIEAARALREHDQTRRLLESVQADRILALGDSHTDDLASWAEILALAGLPVVNAGLSGDTTAAALSRLHRVPPAAHAFVLLGTNDARRHGDHDVLVSDAETRRNLRAIAHVLHGRCRRVTWITPPPVDEERIGRDAALAEAGVSWRSVDVAAKAEILRREQPDAIDLWPDFTHEHLAADGLHVGAAGQRLIAERVVRRLGGG
jgi:lysophospholipase L1-like esterase